MQGGGIWNWDETTLLNRSRPLARTVRNCDYAYMKNAIRTVLAFAVFVAGCKASPTAPATTATATVRYTVTSPFCGPNTYIIDFSADNMQLGIESIKDKGTSKTYTLSVGRHVIGAYIENWKLSFDTVVTLTAGQTFVRDANLYCS